MEEKQVEMPPSLAMLTLMIRMDEGPLARSGKPTLYTRTATPPSPRAALAVVHGYAEHSGRYVHVMGALAELGIATVGIDLRGHGKSDGTRGFCSQFSEYFDDLSVLPAELTKVAPGAPQFLFGHSFGGLATTLSLLQPGAPSYRGLLLSGPFFGLALPVPAPKLWAGKVASRVWPKLGIPSGLKGEDVTHDPERARAYDADPLNFKKATARWFTEATRSQAEVLEQAPRLTLPVLLAFGAADKIASLPAARAVFDRMGSKDREFVPLEGLYHEILNEPSWKDTVQRMATFVLDRV
jgi:alpha-beta hydrolase superfamily lysophospholipase